MRCYAVRNKNKDVVSKSRSGGVFTAVSDYVLSKNGVVYGVILDENFEARHIRATDALLRDKMRGSKYIQSKIGDEFINCKKDLDDGLLVFFTGTPCQIFGLKNFLKQDYKNLITMDVICNGVPDPLLWTKYKEWLKSKYGSEIDYIDFRNKKDFSWDSHVETVGFKNGKVIHSFVFPNLYNNPAVYRKSCYSCKHKNLNRPGDITIGDFWGIKTSHPDFYDSDGTSLVLVNSSRGNAIFEQIKAELSYVETSEDKFMQKALKENNLMPSNREKFWDDFEGMLFEEFLQKYAGYTLKNRIKWKLGLIKKKLLK